MSADGPPPKPAGLGLEATADAVGGPKAPATADTLPAGTLASVSPDGATLRPAVVQPLRPDDPDYPGFVAVDPAHYVLADEIARGGMGRIRRARDRRLRRPVAIKEILVKAGDLAQRFEREARITARLQHPSIVNVHESGVWPTGEPFFAMTLVSGRSLDEVIAEATTLERRLALVPNALAVADAMSYAHGQGVIHRDLKPKNVLVGDFGETVVIDWGLAKDLTSTAADLPDNPYRTPGSGGPDGQTEAGQIMGTPAYMPSEQALGEAVDQRADVYALGALMFHVLAGQPPVTGRTTEEVLAKIIAGPLPSLADTQPGVPPDLLAIVVKAMAFSAADRYPSARELAEDLRRFQTGQLVGAHHYSLGQLVRRWLRRHRTAVAVAAVAAVLLVTIGVASIRRVLRAERTAQAERQLAVQHRADAEGLMDFMLGDLNHKLEAIGKSDLLAVVAEKAIAYYALRPEGTGEIERHQRVVALRNLGDVLSAQGNSTGALTEYRAAFAIAEKLAAQDPRNAGSQRDLAVSHSRVGDILAAQGNAAGALTEYRAALVISEKLVAQDPANAGQQRQLWAVHEKIGEIHRAQGDVAAALAEYRAALVIADKLVALDPNNAERQRELSVSHGFVGLALAAQGEVSGALVEYRAALAIANKLAALDPDNASWQRDILVDHHRIGEILETQGSAAGALVEYRAALLVSKKLVAQDPANAAWQSDLAVSHTYVGDVLRQQGDVAGSLAEYRAALLIGDKLAVQDPRSADLLGRLQIIRLGLGDLLAAQGNATEALAEYRTALDITEKLAAQDRSNADLRRNLSVLHEKVGKIRLARGDAATALAEFRISMAIREKLVASDPRNAGWQRDLSVSYYKAGEALLAQRDVAAALAQYRANLAITETLAAQDPTNAVAQRDLAFSHDSIARAFAKQGDERALTEYRAALAILEKLAAQDPTNAQRQADVAEVRRDLKACCHPARTK